MAIRRGIRLERSIIALLGAGMGCVAEDALDEARTGSALDVLDEPVTTSMSGDTFTATFSGDDADLSFEVDTAGLSSLTTGGGYILSEFDLPGEKATFGFAVGLRDGEPTGHMVFYDHPLGIRVISTEIVALTSAVCATHFEGIGETPFGTFEFNVTVTDAGEPGAGRDTFRIGIFDDGYVNGNVLLGGNITVHETCPL